MIEPEKLETVRTNQPMANEWPSDIISNNSLLWNSIWHSSSNSTVEREGDQRKEKTIETPIAFSRSSIIITLTSMSFLSNYNEDMREKTTVEWGATLTLFLESVSVSIIFICILKVKYNSIYKPWLFWKTWSKTYNECRCILKEQVCTKSGCWFKDIFGIGMEN